MPSKQILIATRSKGKLPEIKSLLSELELDIISLNDLEEFNDFLVEEPALTLEGNAIIKAMTIGFKSGLLTIADDAGLEVDALQGKLGVFTARYATGSDKDRYMKLLREMEGVSSERRTARFRAVVAIFDPTNYKIRTVEGVYEGNIANAPIGSGGFGYDPIFISAQLGKTSAEMSEAEKNSISHRGIAFGRARQILKEEFL